VFPTESVAQCHGDLPPVLGPVDLTPVFWPGSHKLQRGGVLGFIFGWRQHIQG